MTEEQQFEMVERIVTSYGGILDMFPVDRPECAGGVSKLHACFDGVCFPIERAACVSEQMFVYWLHGHMHGPLARSA